MAKLLLPQVYEKMSMQELRALVVERSMMNIYIRGETVEIPNHSIGFLLEGFIKSEEVQQELIVSPAVLYPPCADPSFPNSDMSGNYYIRFGQLLLLFWFSLVQDVCSEHFPWR